MTASLKPCPAALNAALASGLDNKFVKTSRQAGLLISFAYLILKFALIILNQLYY